MQGFGLQFGKGVVILSALMLGACGGSSSKFSEEERDEIADIAGDGAIDEEEFLALKQRVSDLEEKVESAAEVSAVAPPALTDHSLLRRNASEPMAFEEREREEKVEELERKMNQIELDNLIEATKPK